MRQHCVAKKSVVVTLLKAGIDINAMDGNGRTALEILTDYPPHVTYEIVAVINGLYLNQVKKIMFSFGSSKI